MHIGVDVGTSGIKIVIVDELNRVMATANKSLQVFRPYPSWSEQHPDQWWEGVSACLDQLKTEHSELLAQTRGIGLSGQMLGPVFIDYKNRPLRNTILWNDGRAVKEAQELINALPGIGERVGCQPNPNFVGPKILWLRKHEPDVLAKTDCILFPKDYILLQLTGKRVTEPTDACGTQFMDARTGEWAPDLIDLVGINPEWLPSVTAPYKIGGYLRQELARRWGMPDKTIVAAGSGDNFAGAVGVGVGTPGDAVLSVGTSAVMSIVDGSYRPLPRQAISTHPHILPGTYLSMSVVLSATSCLDWAAQLTGRSVVDLVCAAEERYNDNQVTNAPIFLPYVNGIRTPYDMPAARGLMIGIDLNTDVGLLSWAILEGVAFHIVEGFHVQRDAGIEVNNLQFIGGGSRSKLWGEMIATLTGITMDLPYGREVGASLGAAKIAKVASGDMELNDLCTKPPREFKILPNPGLRPVLEERFARFRDVFSHTKHLL